MTIIYTPIVGTAYNFERGIGDTLNGNMPTYLTAVYKDTDVALLDGSMSVKFADTGTPFQLQCTLNNSELGVDSDLTADAKFDLLKALEGTIGSLVKDGRTCTEVELRTVTLTSRQRSMTAYPIAASTHQTVLCTIGFKKLDA